MNPSSFLNNIGLLTGGSFYDGKHGLGALVGQTILDVRILTPDDVLEIETYEGLWTLEASGGCCSESWFDKDHLEGVDLVKGRVVTEVVERDESLGCPDDGRTRQESDSIYSTEIRTTHGVCVFEMRNSSNGYYGGEFSANFQPRVVD